MSNIAVIGGGASGIVASIAAAKNPSNSVTIYESGARIGRKILATGNGRCNLTNMNAQISNYHGNCIDFMRDTIDKFWVNETIDFFKGIGLLPKEEDEGKVYPYSGQASAVLDILRAEAERAGVNICVGFEAKKIKRKSSGFLITSYSGETAYADKVIIATGGKAAPNLGSNGGGYTLLRDLGHQISDLRPSLVQIKTKGDTPKKLKGIKVNARVTLGKNIEVGEVLFTDYGLSGPPIFSLSAFLDGQKSIFLDIMPEYNDTRVYDLVKSRAVIMSDTCLENFFVGMLNKRVGQALLKAIGAAPLSRRAKTLTDSEITALAREIKHWRFDIDGTMSWNNAQVTKGGALTSEFNSETMESKIVGGLYASGEVLDIDGDCGGYNLQWAWSSGYMAGISCGEVK